MPTLPRDRRAGVADRERQRREARALTLTRLREGQARRSSDEGRGAFYPYMAWGPIASTSFPVGTVVNSNLRTGWDNGAATYPYMPHANYAVNVHVPTETTWTTSAATYTFNGISDAARAAVRTSTAHERPTHAALMADENALGDLYDRTVARLAREITEATGLSTELVWQQWTFGATIAPSREDTWLLWVRAINATDDATLPEWERWADGTAHSRDELPDRDSLQIVWDGEQRRREAQRRHDRVQRLRARVADRRAVALLNEVLDDEQRASWADHQRFRVTAGSGRIYEITNGFVGNIYRLNDEGERETSYCIHGSGPLPVADHVLAQKLLLEANEDEFLRIANESWIMARTTLAEMALAPGSARVA